MSTNHKATPSKEAKKPAQPRPAPPERKAQEQKAAEAWLKDRLVDVYNA